MYLEFAGFFGLFVALLFLFAEIGKRYELEVIAGCLLIVFGFWILSDGLQIQTGEMITTTGAEDLTGYSSILTGTENHTLTNTTDDAVIYHSATALSNTTLNTTTTHSYVYQDIPATPYTGYADLIGISCLLLGIYGAFSGILKFMDATK